MVSAYHYTDDLKLTDDNKRHHWIREGIKVANLDGANSEWPVAVDALDKQGSPGKVQLQLAPWSAAVSVAAANMAGIAPKLGGAFRGLSLTLRNPLPFTRALTFRGLLRLITGKRDHKVRGIEFDRKSHHGERLSRLIELTAVECSSRLSIKLVGC